MQVSKGKHKDHTLADQPRSSKCSTLHAVSDHAGLWHLSAPSQSWRCQLTPISKDKSFLQVSHESSKCGAPRHAVEVWGGLSSLDSANSCVLHPKQRASDSTCCDGQRQHNLSEHLREKQEEPRRSCTAISLACPHGVSVLIPLGCRCCKLWLLVQLIMPHLVPFAQLWVTLYFCRYWTHCKLFFWLNL